jgi:hypothetical protein
LSTSRHNHTDLCSLAVAMTPQVSSIVCAGDALGNVLFFRLENFPT